MDRNPQAKEMAHESMVRNLAAQAAAIWPHHFNATIDCISDPDGFAFWHVPVVTAKVR